MPRLRTHVRHRSTSESGQNRTFCAAAETWGRRRPPRAKLPLVCGLQQRGRKLRIRNVRAVPRHRQRDRWLLQSEHSIRSWCSGRLQSVERQAQTLGLTSFASFQRSMMTNMRTIPKAVAPRLLHQEFVAGEWSRIKLHGSNSYPLMSALPPKADTTRRDLNVR